MNLSLFELPPKSRKITYFSVALLVIVLSTFSILNSEQILLLSSAVIAAVALLYAVFFTQSVSRALLYQTISLFTVLFTALGYGDSFESILIIFSQLFGLGVAADKVYEN